MEELTAQGVPKAVVLRLKDALSEHVDFACGGGVKSSSEGMIISSPAIGRMEAFYMDKGPCAIPQVVTTNENAAPYIHVNGKMPWFCSDASKLTIICPEKYRIYADRLDLDTLMFLDRPQRKGGISQWAA